LNGTFIIDKALLTVSQLLANEKALPSYSHLALANGEYLVATRKEGLIKVSKSGEMLANYSDLFSQLSPFVYDMSQDNNNNIWLATKGAGIFRLIPDTNQLQEFNIDNSNLPSNIFWQVEKDKLGRMWFTGSKGLVRFDSELSKFQVFDRIDGLQDLAYTPAADYRADIDKMLLGGINGFNYFSPSKIKIDKHQLKVSITDFELNYKASSLLNSRTTGAIEEGVDLYLKYDQNIFSFDFSALDFTNPTRIEFAYMLEGYKNTWTETNSLRRTANFTNISPGNYTFKVRAANKDGVWSNNISKIKIKITPPWWHSNIAYISYILLSMFMVYSFIRFKTKSLEKRAVNLEEIVKTRTQELQSEKHKVEQLLLSKNEEFANISHEFRTPLTLILGPTNQLLKNISQSENIERLNIIQRSGYRLLRMVDQLLNLETFKIKALAKKTPQAVGKTIQLISQAFKDLAAEKNITLNIGHVEDISFEFTPDALEKIVLNLLSNAIKYTPKEGTISIETSRTSNNKLQIKVVDSGIGIEKSKHELVFKRFHRVIDQESESVTGAGIGLALVKNLVDIHNGDISIDSEIGVGTKITITLPIVGEVDSSKVDLRTNDEIIAMEMMNITENTKTNKESKTEPSNTNDNHPTILVVEDNQDMRQYIVENLSSKYKCLTAANGRVGCEIAQREIPDVVISDVMMPEMDGFEVTKRLRNDDSTSHIPIILLTARGDKESRIRGWNEKADEYLTKPFDSDELLIRIENILDIRDILRKRFSEKLFTEISQAEPAITKLNTQEEQQNTFINKLNEILEQQYQDSDFKMVQLLPLIAMSERQLYRKLKAISDLTPTEYLRRFRLDKAQVLLSSGKTASFVSLEVGFSSHSYFARCFKAQFSISPSEFNK